MTMMLDQILCRYGKKPSFWFAGGTDAWRQTVNRYREHKDEIEMVLFLAELMKAWNEKREELNVMLRPEALARLGEPLMVTWVHNTTPLNPEVCYEGYQIRCWYAPPASICRCHADSCNRNILFDMTGPFEPCGRIAAYGLMGRPPDTVILDGAVSVWNPVYLEQTTIRKI